MFSDSIHKGTSIEIKADDVAIIASALGVLMTSDPSQDSDAETLRMSILTKLDNVSSFPANIQFLDVELARIIFALRMLPSDYAGASSDAIDDLVMRFPVR